jgi:hypothetical protein
MKSKLFTLFSLVSLLLFVVICVLWAGTRSERLRLSHNVAHCTYDTYEQRIEKVAINRGRFEFSFLSDTSKLVDPGPPPEDDIDWRVTRWHGDPWPVDTLPRRLGFGLVYGRNQGFVVVVIWIPTWFACLVTAVMPARWSHRRIRSARSTATGCCPSCGYDLRATPDRCPECGTMTVPA